LATVRIEKTSDYTVVANAFLDDERLSLKAVGLLSYMLRLPDDWNFTLEWLAGKHKDGLSAIRSAIQELESAGYVSRSDQVRTEGGTFRGADYVVREIPVGGAPTACENRTRTACENPISENRTRSHIKKPNTIGPSTNPPIAPQGAGADFVPHSTSSWKPERFDSFWKFYPLHKSKQAAIKAWDKLKPSDELLAVIGKALKRQIAEEQARAARERRPFEWKLHASTYLNGARWTDEPVQTMPLPPAPAGSAEEVGERW